jgi:intracellular sulfur oxidation DsrE/DsrF family protein
MFSRKPRISAKGSVVSLLLSISALTFTCGALAQEPVSEEKPFAEAFIILQLSDQDPLKQDAVLDVANNLIKHYGSPDLVDIEIIAFGPGMRLLLAGNTREVRISSLVESGVRFIGCMNTVDTMERKTGERPELNEHTIPVQTGVAYIVEKAREGYVLVRP